MKISTVQLGSTVARPTAAQQTAHASAGARACTTHAHGVAVVASTARWRPHRRLTDGEKPNLLEGNGLLLSRYMLLHQNLLELARNVVLTGDVLG
jgi:hypothetical protein